MTDASGMWLAVGFTAWCLLLAIGAATEHLWNRTPDERRQARRGVQR